MERFSTADLCDEFQEKNIQILSPNFNNYGGKKSFKGKIKTIEIDKSNWGLIDLLKNSSGKGNVLVVDAKEEFYGVIGDRLSLMAQDAGYEAIILNGYVRDTPETKKFDLALYALGTCPQRNFEKTQSQVGVELNFANVNFKPNSYMYSDEDGIILCDEEIYPL